MAAPFKLDEIAEKELTARYTGGESASSLAAAYSLNRTTVVAIVRRHDPDAVRAPGGVTGVRRPRRASRT